MVENEDETYSVMFLSLKHPIRRKILRILDINPCTFTEILQQTSTESAHLSYHLESLGDLITKADDGRYGLSQIGKAAISVMKRVEEPDRYAPAKIARMSKRFRVMRALSLVLLVLGISLLVTALFAFAPPDYNSALVQRTWDTDSWSFAPYNVTAYSGYDYLGDGLYGLQIDLAFNESYKAMFPLTVRLSTANASGSTLDYWNQSWYEWSPSTILSVSGMRETLALTLLVRGGTARVVSEYTFDHVHFSPGAPIEQLKKFRPANAIVLVKVAPELGNTNVTLEGFRAFEITWFYFPVQNDGQRILLFSSLGLLVSSAVLMAASDYVSGKEQ